MLPTQSQVEVPLLEALIELGGEAKPKDIYPIVTRKFPEITEEDLAIRLKHGELKWTNTIQWARQHLKDSGEMSSPKWGVWGITDKGRERVQGRRPAAVPAAKSITLVELHQEYEKQFREKLLDRLHQLDPTQFEHFGKHLLSAYGFVKTEVTRKTGDGGIDGYGSLKVGLAKMNVAFQCKRWQSNVPREEVDKFRGAIQGEFEQGIYFATSGFTKGAMEASIRKGAVPIVLLDGASIVELMIEKEFGVQKKPLQVYEDELDSIFGEADPEALG